MIESPHFPVVRVLVVDDSNFMRAALAHILKSDAGIEVVNTAVDGVEAVEKVKQYQPDVVLLDIQMPRMDGLTALEHIMAEFPTPVVMLSGLARADTTVAIEALEKGAVDFIVKPSGTISYDIEEMKDEIISKVKLAATVKVSKLDSRFSRSLLQHRRTESNEMPKVVVIGASTGGPRAIYSVLSGVGREIRAAFIVVQHMSPEFVPSFIERLKWGCLLDVGLARRGEIIKPGKVLVAPGGENITIAHRGDRYSVSIRRHKAPQSLVPSINLAMTSAAEVYGRNAIGVLLTGMGEDGANGMKAIKDAGGHTIAEDESTCLVFGMPKAAIELGYVDAVVPLPLVPAAISKLLQNSKQEL